MQKYDLKRIVSDYEVDAFEMVKKDELDLGDFLVLVLYDDKYYDKICEKLTSYHKYEIVTPVKDFTVPKAEYEGKSGLVKLEYNAVFKYYDHESDKDDEDDYQDEDEEDKEVKTREETRYTNISFTMNPDLKQIIFWFPLFS
jgi:hypothetical protein